MNWCNNMLLDLAADASKGHFLARNAAVPGCMTFRNHAYQKKTPSWKPWSFGSLVLIEAAPRQVHSMFSSILPLQSEYIHTSIYPLYHDQACGPNDYNNHGFQSQSFLSLKPMIIWYSCSQWSKPHLVKYTAYSRARPLLFGYILHGVHTYYIDIR